ncbi:MAG: hypothetical protein Q9170_007997 [Blastenia crenularia]
MPYTPPTQRSLVASGSNTPSQNIPSSSGEKQQLNGPSSQSMQKPALPRSSSSYLNRHRRSPSLTKPTASFSIGPDDNNDGIAKGTADVQDVRINGLVTASVGESPPTSSPSDEESHTSRGRRPDSPRVQELRAAIMFIEQRRESSPEKVSEERIKARQTLGLGRPRIDPLAKEHATNPELTPPPPLSEAARKISHSRSSTEMSALLDVPRTAIDTPTRSASESDLDDMGDDLIRKRPTPVRKKSGELVKPVLTKGGLRRRPSSMPGTPTYGKAVHFDPSSLENVRTFCGSDRPIVVSAGTSPAEQYSSDIEFPFGDDPARKRTSAFEWEIRLANFPRETLQRKLAPVRVERIYLSSDNKNLMGAIAVANLAFHKLVVARFTLDYWKTTSEVVADYSRDVRRKHIEDGCDRFTFNIKLEDQANLENKTLFFCVRYSVNGQEYWDNNNSVNYQVDFDKKPKETKQGTQGTSLPLPRSKSSSTSSVRPRSFPSFPSGLDDFGEFDSNFEFPSSKAPPAQIVGDSPIRLKSQKHTEELVGDGPTQRSSTSTQPFGNRYNFGVSLHNAIAAASPGLGERGDPSFKSTEKPAAPQNMSFAKQPMVESGSMSSVKAVDKNPTGEEKSANGSDSSRAKAKPAALTTEKPSCESMSYQDLLNTYCFFGTEKSGPKGSTAPAKSQPPTQSDGAVDEPVEPEPEPETELESEPARAKLHLKPQTKAHLMSEEIKTPPRVTSPRLSHNHSPGTGSASGSRAGSPVFGYPYTQPMQNGFFGEPQTPTAIRG